MGKPKNVAVVASIEVPAVVEVVEVVETLEQSIERKKAELNAMLAEQKALKERIKALKAEDIMSKKADKELKAKERTEKLQKLMQDGIVVVKENKSQKVRELLLQGKSKEEMKELLGYDNKFLLDTIWRIEKSLGL